jgi:hypothetical protein
MKHLKLNKKKKKLSKLKKKLLKHLKLNNKKKKLSKLKKKLLKHLKLMKTIKLYNLLMLFHQKQLPKLLKNLLLNHH